MACAPGSARTKVDSSSCRRSNATSLGLSVSTTGRRLSSAPEGSASASRGCDHRSGSARRCRGSCNDDDRDPRANKEPRQNLVEQRDGACGWHGAVTGSASDGDSVDAFGACQVDELFEDVGLVIQQRAAVEITSEVSVSGVEEKHSMLGSVDWNCCDGIGNCGHACSLNASE